MTVSFRCAVVLLLVSASIVSAQEFGVSPWVGSTTRSNFQNYEQPLMYRGYRTARPVDVAPVTSSYRVERDSRYFPAMVPVRPASYTVPSYPTPSWEPAALPTDRFRPIQGACGNGYVPPAFRYPISPNPTVPPGGAGYSHRATLPKGYYRGDGIFGKDTVFASNQPVRNFFRFILP